MRSQQVRSLPRLFELSGDCGYLLLFFLFFLSHGARLVFEVGD